MRPFSIIGVLWLFAIHQTLVYAPWSKGMYCFNGTTGQENRNTDDAVQPLYMLEKSDWWFHHNNKCDEFPPAAGDYLVFPAGGSVTVEIANNRAQTSLSYSGKFASDWTDGNDYPNNYNVDSCITKPNIHTQNETMAAGSAFAISYQSKLSAVTPDNLVVFTVQYHTPWKRLATFQVPSDMPPCPAGGCICAWGWIPNGCGEPNIYMTGYRCMISNSRSSRPLAKAKPPVWCEGEPSACVSGAKQMIFWHQLSGNNVNVTGYDLGGHPKSPGYNTKMGFQNGPQTDIFA